MRPLTDVLTALEKLGVVIVVGKDRQPRITRNGKRVTRWLLQELSYHRKAIIHLLGPPVVVECLLKDEETVLSSAGYSEFLPTGTWWWRYQGDETWRPHRDENTSGRPPHFLDSLEPP